MTQTKKCPICGASFEGRANRLYCSEKCKMTAFYNKDQDVKTVEFSTDNPLNESQKKLFANKSVEQLIPVTVMFTLEEKGDLEEKAAACGVELGKYISIRSQMSETDVNELNKIISKQQAELEKLKIELTFYKSSGKKPQQHQKGLLIEMNDAQKEFLKEKYLESYDYTFNGFVMLSDDTTTNNHRVELEYNENKDPGSLENSIGFDMLFTLLDEMEMRFIDEQNYDRDEMYGELYDQFINLEDS